MRIRCGRGQLSSLFDKWSNHNSPTSVSLFWLLLHGLLHWYWQLISLLFIGVRFTSYHGNFMLRSTDLMALPAVDCDKAYAMQLCLEETLLTTDRVYFQVALLYPLCWKCVLLCFYRLVYMSSVTFDFGIVWWITKKCVYIFI